MNQPSVISHHPAGESTDPFEGTAYRLIRSLARGGMGQVYLVEHRELGRQCVAKLVHEKLATQPQLLERVRIEAESLGTLNHPNIVTASNFGTTGDGRPFIVIEYLRGRDLGRELASGRAFTLDESLQLVLDAACALSAAHDIGIVHRDVKPENLFLCEESDGGRTLKLLDFGVARVIPGVSVNTPTPMPQPTATGVIVGTLRYASPESLAGKRADYRADVYSLGLVLYRLLAGRTPFGDELKDSDLMAACLSEEPKPPSAFSTVRIPPELDQIVLKALRKSPDERYASMRLFSKALSQLRESINANANATRPIAPTVPLTPESYGDIRLLATTETAARLGSGKRDAVINALLFAIVLLVTTSVVSIVVAHLRQATGAP